MGDAVQPLPEVLPETDSFVSFHLIHVSKGLLQDSNDLRPVSLHILHPFFCRDQILCPGQMFQGDLPLELEPFLKDLEGPVVLFGKGEVHIELDLSFSFRIKFDGDIDPSPRNLGSDHLLDPRLKRIESPGQF